MPVLDLQAYVPCAQSNLFGLISKPLLLLLDKLDLFTRRGWPELTVCDVPPHVAHGHTGGGQAGDPHQLVEVVLLVDAMLAACSATDRRDHPDGIVIAQGARRQPGQGCCLLDRVTVQGRRRTHAFNGRNFMYLKCSSATRIFLNHLGSSADWTEPLTGLCRALG